ncbi:2'-deoxynucleoside 5'-phosphate N-hydrolase 1 [Lamellibrachia satsuma]|nr:2'-deoxynucleoside 5'-phosphate N-hydrolase 1 [Lamellibrachia satsuma]
MTLKIYFCGSIRGGRQDGQLYAEIIAHLKTFGTVLTEYVGKEDLLPKEPKDTSVIYTRYMNWLRESDVIIAEVTQPSLGVGFELGQAVALGKKILCLFRPASEKKLSCMIEGAHDDKNFTVVHYEESQAIDIITKFMSSFTNGE